MFDLTHTPSKNVDQQTTNPFDVAKTLVPKTRKYVPRLTHTLTSMSHTRKHVPYSQARPTLPKRTRPIFTGTSHTRRHVPHSQARPTLASTSHTRKHVTYSQARLTHTSHTHTHAHTHTSHTRRHVPYSQAPPILAGTSHTRRHVPHSQAHTPNNDFNNSTTHQTNNFWSMSTPLNHKTRQNVPNMRIRCSVCITTA